nr:hypothetical protein [Tanacetum cinerariifolium]
PAKEVSKTDLAIYSIKQRKGESVRAFATSLSKSTREILAMEKVAKTFEQPPRLPRSKWSRDKTNYCHFHEEHEHDTNQCQELRHQIEEAVKSGQLAQLVKGLKKKKEKVYDIQLGEWKEERRNAKPAETHVLMISRLLIGFFMQYSWPLGEVPLEIMMGKASS